MMFAPLNEPWLIFFFSRASIGFSFTIGALLLTDKAAIWLLAAAWTSFSVLLLAYASIAGNLRDCVCFREFTGRISAVVLAVDVLLLMACIVRALQFKKLDSVAAPVARDQRRAAVLTTVAAILGCVILFGVSGYSKDSSEENIVPLLGKERPFARFVVPCDSGNCDLGNGEYLVAMLSASCSHCAASVEALNEIALVPQFPRLVALVLGDERMVETFKEQTSPQFPMLPMDIETFFSLSGTPPRIIKICNGKQLRFWDSEEVDAAQLAEDITATQ
jgi:hypothetical protein